MIHASVLRTYFLVNLIILAAMVVSWPVAALAASFVSDVRIADEFVDLGKGGNARISWNMSQPGAVTLLICDLDGRVVRNLYDKQAFPAGAARVDWDGHDDTGAACPDGAYIPILRVNTKTLHQVYNPTTEKWGEQLNVEDIRYDSHKQKIVYRLNQPALCLIRIGGDEGGPLYRTFTKWVPKTAGTHEEPWDGMDAQGLVKIADKSEVKIIIYAIILPENAILVTGSSAQHSFKHSKLPRYHLHPPSGKNVFMHSLHQRQFCRDINISVSVDGRNGAKDNTPILDETTIIRINIPDRDHLEYLEREGMEIYAFVEGVFATELKVKTFPTRFTLNTDSLSEGRHILTINVRSTEDHVGTYSMAVRVAK